MATIHHFHDRTPSGHKFVLRPTGSRPLTRNHSSKTLSKTSKRRSADPDTLADDFDMAMSFHQFCATCEKQIAVPSTSILYCSENCRRFDGTVGLALGAPPSPPLLSEYESFTKRPALARRKLHHALSNFSIPSDQHDGKSDMDPTEWKPNESASLPGGAGGGNCPTTSRTEMTRTNSEAFLYLSQFHRSSESLIKSSRAARSRTDRKNAASPDSGATKDIGFYLTPTGSNDSSITGTPVESSSAMTSGTAPSITFDLGSPHERITEADKTGMGFTKKAVSAREEVGGSLGRLLSEGACAQRC